MIAIVKLKKCMASICIFSIVIDKLSYWKEFSIVILLIVDKSSEINFYYTILLFGLAISYKMKRNKKPLFNLKGVV